MSEERYQEKQVQRKQNLIEELQNKYKKAEGQEIQAQVGLGYQAKTEKGLSLSRKIEGLSLLRDRVKAQGAVVSADMLSEELQKEYHRDYGLSKKELERMLNEMQQGMVEDFTLDVQEYAPMRTHRRSELSVQENMGETSVYKELGALLKQKREEKSLASFQLAVLDKDVAAQFKKDHSLSEKELKKISLDIQTQAVSVNAYGSTETISEKYSRLREEALAKEREQQRLEEERSRQLEAEMERLEQEKVLAEQKLREESVKREARKKYLETGITTGVTAPTEWPLGVYADVADVVMIKHYGNPLDMQNVKETAATMTENLYKNRSVLRKMLQETSKKFGSCGLPQFLEDEMAAAFEQKQVEYFLVDGMEQNKDFQNAFAAEGSRLEKIMGRAVHIHSKIGKNRFDTSVMKNDQIKELYKMTDKNTFEITDEAFKEKCGEYAEQAEFHLKYIDDVLKRRVTVLNREVVSKSMIRDLGENLLFRSTKAVFDLVENYLDNLPEDMKECEKNAAAALQGFPEQIRRGAFDAYNRVEHMPQAAWDKLIIKTLNAKDGLETMKQKLGNLAKLVEQNLAAFRKNIREMEWELPVKMWNALYEYRSEIADDPKFMDKIVEKTRELLNGYKKDGKLDFGDEVRMEMEEHYSFLTRDLDFGKALNIQGNFVNRNRLEGDELLQHPDFEMAFKADNDMFFNVLEGILAAGELDGALPFLKEKEIRTVNGLDYLSYTEMNRMFALLRQNMRARISRWSHIVGPFAYEIKTELLREIMLGLNAKEDMDKRIDKERKRFMIEDPAIKKMRTRFILAAEENVVRTDEILSELDKTCYYNRYKDKFDDARLLWNILKERKPEEKILPGGIKDKVMGGEEQAFIFCEQYADSDSNVLKDYADHYGKSKTYKENPAAPLKNYLRRLAWDEKGKAENAADKVSRDFHKERSKTLEKLADKLSRGSKDNFINEFLMCGNEDLFLHKNANSLIRDILTKPRKSVDNEAAILHHAGLFVFNNVNMIRKELAKAGVKKEDYQKYMERLIPFSMGLFTRTTNEEKTNPDEWEKEKERQLNHMGVTHREELRKEIQKYFQEDMKSSSVNKDEMLDSQLERYNRMANYRGGILKPVLPYLIQNIDFWFSMAKTKEDEFDAKIEKMVDRCGLPLEILQSRFSHLGPALYESICNRFAKDIIFGDTKDRVGWLKVFDDYFKDYSKYKLGDFSIPALTEERRKKNAADPVLPYITEILYNHQDGLELVKPENRWKLDKILDDFSKTIGKNVNLLKLRIDDYLANSEEFMGKENNTQAEQAFEKGCTLYLQRQLVNQSPENFAAELDKMMADYLRKRAEMMVETKEAEYVMSEREKALSDVLYHKDLGVQTYPEDALLLDKLRSDVSKTGSPLQAALGVKNRVARRKIKKTREEMKDFSQYPQAVQDCLYERKLSDVNDETLKKETEWLKDAYDLAKLHIEKTLSEEERNALPSQEKAISELLLFVYIRELKKEKENFGAKISQNNVEQSYEELKDRHSKMSELLDQKYTWARAYEPVFWNTSKDPDASYNVEENPVLAPHRRMVMEAMTAGIYALEKDQFDDLMNKQIQFLNNATIADQIFKDALQKHHIPEEQHIELRTALLNYNRAYLMVKGTAKLRENPLGLQQQADRLLQDQNYVNAMLTGKLMDSTDSKAAEEQEKAVSVTALGELKKDFKEKQNMSSVANRKTLEDFLTTIGERKKGYNELTQMERVVFALCVLQGELEAKTDKKATIYDFPSMRFIHSNEVLESRQTIIATQLADYVSCRPFEPEISYEKVMDRLRNTKGGLNKEVYDEAIAQTKEYSLQRRQNMPKDFHLLNDGAYSISEAKRLLKQEYTEEKTEFAELVSLREWIIKQDSGENLSGSDKKKITNVKKELAGLNQYQLSLLALALNDRTMLDVSTLKAREDETVNYVNQEKRDNFVKVYGDAPEAYGDVLQKAGQTLLSYQLRDDVELYYGRELKKNDFAPDALKRETKIDWALLERAMSFVKAISAAQVKI